MIANIIAVRFRGQKPSKRCAFFLPVDKVESIILKKEKFIWIMHSYEVTNEPDGGIWGRAPQDFAIDTKKGIFVT